MRSVIGQQAVREQLADFLTDESRYTEGTPEKVFFPETEADILFALEVARSEGRSITLIGGKTGIAGGSVPVDGCVAICFSAMNKIRSVQPGSSDTLLLECGPGTTLKEIERFLEDPRGWPGPVPAGDLPAGNRFFYPPDPTEMDAELGGTVATNASGARSFRFGATRAHVEAVSIVLASGETATIRRGHTISKSGALTFRTDQGATYTVTLPVIDRRTVKNAAGYFIGPDIDLIDLLIGSEGTLAIFSSITIRTRRVPRFLSGLSFFPSRTNAFGFADFLRKEQHVSAIEYFDTSALSLLIAHRDQMALPDFPPNCRAAILWEFFEDDAAVFDDRLEQWEEALSQCGSSFDATWAGFDDEGRERLRVFRHAVPEIINSIISRNKSKVPSIRKISSDAAVQIERFHPVFDQQIALIEKTGLHHVVFGHLGDGHLHINLIPGDCSEMAQALTLYDQLMAIVIENRGTISAEHGIGKLKKKYLLKMYGEEATSGMKLIKRVFDPKGLLSPGNLFES